MSKSLHEKVNLISDKDKLLSQSIIKALLKLLRLKRLLYERNLKIALRENKKSFLSLDLEHTIQASTLQ